MARSQEDLKGLQVCFFGHYDPSYSRNRVLMKALRTAGAQVIEVRDAYSGMRRWRVLISRGITASFDLLFVGFPGHTDMLPAWLVASLKRRPVVFDAFLSLYDTAVFDRKTVSHNSLGARRLYWVDKLACTLARLVLLDTQAHIHYFVNTFRLPVSKFRRVWVGTDEDVMRECGKPSEGDNFTVFFYGSYIPLHGAEFIVKAARLLEEREEKVRFVMVGSGQTFPQVSRLAESLRVRSVEFMGRVPYERLAEMISKSHICLGIFGTTPKAGRVIPNKVFDALAVGRPVVTADTPAIREVFTHGENIWLVPPGDERALAEAIITLKMDDALRKRLATNGHGVFKDRFSIDAITQDLTRIILEIL